MVPSASNQATNNPQSTTTQSASTQTMPVTSASNQATNNPQSTTTQSASNQTTNNPQSTQSTTMPTNQDTNTSLSTTTMVTSASNQATNNPQSTTTQLASTQTMTVTSASNQATNNPQSTTTQLASNQTTNNPQSTQSTTMSTNQARNTSSSTTTTVTPASNQTTNNPLSTQSTKNPQNTQSTTRPTAALTTTLPATPTVLCSSNQYEYFSGNSTYDRICNNHTVCSATQFESKAPSSTENRECKDKQVCTSNQFEYFSGNSTYDRICNNHAVCSATQFESKAPSSTENRECKDKQVCSSNQYEYFSGNSTNDRICRATWQRAAEEARKASSNILNRTDISKDEKEKLAREEGKRAMEFAMNKTVSNEEFILLRKEAAIEDFGIKMGECVKAKSVSECQGTVAKETLKIGLGKTHIEDSEVQEFIEIAAQRAVQYKMKACMTSANNITSAPDRQAAITVCSTNSAREALQSNLGENVSAVEVQKFIENAATNSVQKAIESAMSSAGTSEERQAAARRAAKGALAQTLGKSNVTEAEVQQYINEGAKAAVMTRMKACTESVNTSDTEADQQTARAACKSYSARKALENSLGASVTDVEVEAFIHEGAKAAVGEAMSSCVKAAVSDKAKLDKCKSESARTALENSLGEAVSDVDVERFLQDSAKESAADAMKAAMASSSLNNTAKEALARGEAKKALQQSLGVTNITETELQSFLNEGAKDAVANTMKACMAGATTAIVKSECKSKSAKEALATSLGKADVTDVELEEFLKDGAKAAVGEAMASCSKVAEQSATPSKDIADCKANSVKIALQNSIGKDLTSTDVEQFVRDGAKDAANRAMKAAMQVDGTAVEKKEAAEKAAKVALSQSLGKENVTNIELKEFIYAGAKDAVGASMKACMENAGRDNSKQIECKTEVAKQTLAESLGLKTVSQEDVELFVRKSARDQAMKTMQASASANATASERKKAVTAALTKALGNDVTPSRVEEFIEAGAKSAVKAAMSACSATANAEGNATSKRNVLSKCKQDAAKKALASTLGKTDVEDNEIESFVRDAAKTAVAEAMVAAMSDNTASPAERKEAAKQALAQTLGESAEDIDDTSFELFKNKGAISAIGDAMASCSSAANLGENEALKKEKMDTCLSNNAKVALQQALGSTSEPSEVEVKKFVAKAGKTSAVDSRKACMKAADDDATKMAKCTSDLSELKATIKSSNGGADVTAETAEAFVMAGAVSKTSEEMISCYRVSKSDQSKLDECKARIARSIGTFLGKPMDSTRRRLQRNLVGDIKRARDVQAEEIKTDGVSGHLLDVIKACHDSEVGESGKKACFSNMGKNKEAVEEVSGTASVSSVAIQRMKKMAQIKVLKATNEALHGSNGTDNAVKEDLKVYGIDFDAERLKVSEIASRAGSLQVALTAIACDAAGTPSNDCKFLEARERAVGSGAHGRRLMSDSAQKIKREGAEELLARKILAQSETREGVLSSGNGGVVDGSYKLLRDAKFQDADVAKVKAKLAGEYMVDCQATNDTTFEVCRQGAAAFLKNDIRGKRPLDDSLVRAQFDIFSHAMGCGANCERETAGSVSKLGLVSSEIGARKISAAITMAADAKVDCLQVGRTENECDIEAGKAFATLGAGYGQSQFLQKSVKFLADAKWKGTVTEMKKFHSTTSLAVYPSPCDEDTTASLVRHISKELASLYQHSLVSVQLEAAVNVGTEECQVILVSSLDEQLNLTSIERLARNVTRPFRFSRGRRLSSVSISTSISVSEVDPKNLARPGGSLRDQKYQSMADKVMQNAGLIIGVFIGAVALVVAFFYFREDSDKGIKNARRKAKMKRLKTAGSAVSRGAQRSSAFESHPEVLVSIEMSTAVNFKENPMHNPNLSNSRISPVKKILS
jgi:hypothetical protein